MAGPGRLLVVFLVCCLLVCGVLVACSFPLLGSLGGVEARVDLAEQAWRERRGEEEGEGGRKVRGEEEGR